ncbi:synaptotagmin-2-like isoform X1 [Clavelina lepadiformis]|uniref:synaptotagmin-2-like isoform X1 n=1 Tax=Clavelina lepadiformis TaxID=159417 RepID=UPI004042EE33
MVDLSMKMSLQERPAEKADVHVGDLLLRLRYLPNAGKLSVVIFKARLFNEVGPEGDKKPPCPYVRVSVLHNGTVLWKRKTSTKQKTCNPAFNQPINIALPINVLSQIAIKVHVIHEAGVRRGYREVIGSFEIGSRSTGDELAHWRDLMNNQPQARWHRLWVKADSEIPGTSGRSGACSLSSVPGSSSTTKILYRRN